MGIAAKYMGGPLPLGLEVAVSVGLFVHKGLVTGNDHFGNPLVTSSSFRRGMAVEEPMGAFSSGKDVTLLGFRGTLPPVQCAARARSMIGRRWTLDLNCEHFVAVACGEEPTSPQLQFWLKSLTVVGGLVLLANLNA